MRKKIKSFLFAIFFRIGIFCLEQLRKQGARYHLELTVSTDQTVSIPTYMLDAQYLRESDAVN